MQTATPCARAHPHADSAPPGAVAGTSSAEEEYSALRANYGRYRMHKTRFIHRPGRIYGTAAAHMGSSASCSSAPPSTEPAHQPTHTSPLRATPTPGAPHTDTHSAHTRRGPAAPGPPPPIAAPLPLPPPRSSSFVVISSTADGGPCAKIEVGRRAATGKVPPREGASARERPLTADARQARLSAERSDTCSSVGRGHLTFCVVLR